MCPPGSDCISRLLYSIHDELRSLQSVFQECLHNRYFQCPQELQLNLKWDGIFLLFCLGFWGAGFFFVWGSFFVSCGRKIKHKMSLRSWNSDLIGWANLIVPEQQHCTPLPAKCMLIMRFALDKTLVGHSAVVICH